MTARVEKALNNLRREIAKLRARLALPAFTDAQTEQAKALRHFLERTLQMSEASDSFVVPISKSRSRS